MKKIILLLPFLGMAFFMVAQRPNPAYRLPESPDMPQWAKKLYHENLAVNAYEIHEEFEAWEESIGLKELEAKNRAAGIYEENVWEEYYHRWRHAVSPYVQIDGSVDFSKGPVRPKSVPSKYATGAEKPLSSWSRVGPIRTYWAKNDNAAQPLAPWQTNFYSLDVAPSNSSILYCGASTGSVCKTTDKGLNWTPVGLDYAGFLRGNGSIAIHPTDPNIVYVGNNSGVHKTTDGGTTWTHDFNLANYEANDIKIKPDAPETVLAGGSSLRLRTAGPVWNNLIDRQTYDIDFKPDDPSIVYALIRNVAGDLCEFYKSTDGGATFSVRSTGWIGALGDGGARLTVTPIDANRIYVVLLTSSGPRILRSSDAGETWTLTASGLYSGGAPPLAMDNGQGFFDLSISASHSNADHIIVGTTTAYKSTDGGVNFTALGGYAGPFNIHPDIQEMKTVGGDSWIATDGGVNLSTDFWTSTTNHFGRINGLSGSDFWGYNQGWNEDAIVGGRYHNGNTAWHENYPAGDYLRMGGGEQSTGYLNPANSRMAYFSDLPGGGRVLPAAFNEQFTTFSVSKFPNEHYLSMQWSDQVWDPRYSCTYYLGKDNVLWRTKDNGASFTPLFTHSDGTAKVQHIEVSRTDPNTIYCTVQASSFGELWKSTDAGVTWTQTANPVGPSTAARRYSKVVLSGTDANVLWWCFRLGPNGNKIFKSTDGGATWTNLTTAALDGVNLSDMVHQLGTDGGIYLSGDFGAVFYRNNSLPDWEVYNTSLPAQLSAEISRIKAFYKGKKLRHASIDGVWEIDLYENSTTTLAQPMAEKETVNCNRDTVQMESYSVVNGNATYQWSFSPAPLWVNNLNIRNPRLVLGATPGAYSATLTVTDDNGVTTRTINNLISNLPSGNTCSADTIPGKALILDGSGDYAQASDALNLNSNTVSMTAWVKRNGAQTDFSGLVYARGGTTSAGLSIRFSNDLRYTWDDAIGSYGFNTGFTIPDNEWTHIALVITPTSATVYMNGVPATRTAAHAAEAFDTPLRIGYDQGGRYFKGQIDEVTVWNKSLTQDEVRELMHLTHVPASQPNLVSYYQFNEMSGTAYDKVSSRHATLLADATRVVSTGPFGPGTSSRQTVAAGGLVTFPGTGVLLGFPIAGTYPNGEIVVTRINLAPDTLPTCSPYHSDDHYWIINNYGTNQTFTALDSARFENFLVPPLSIVSPTSYSLNTRAANDHLLLPWTVKPGNSIGAAEGANGYITFGPTSNITQFGQFLPTNAQPGDIITGPSSVCSGGNVTLDAGAGHFSYAWSNGGGSGQMATYNNVTMTTTYTVTVSDANGCTGTASKMVTVNAAPNCNISGPASVCSNSTGNMHSAPADLDGYAWSIAGNGVITTALTGQSIEVTAGASGTYTVSVVITNSNGCTATCSQTVPIELVQLTLTSSGPASATCGDMVAIEVRVSNSFTDISAYQYSVNWDQTQLQYVSNTALQIGGAGGDPILGIGDVANGNFTYSWADPSGFDGENLADATVVLTLNMKVLASSGSATVNISGSPTAFELVNKNFCLGVITPANNVSIALSPITVTCPANTSVCIDAPPIALSGGSPAGGTYSGTGVNGMGIFSPFVAGLGTHTITYSYTDGNGCSNTCTYTITVNALPMVTCPANSAVETSDPAFALTGGNPMGGTYSGAGVSMGSFDPAVAGVGTHTITYSFTDGNSCTNTCTFTITVNSGVSCPANSMVCLNAPAYVLTGGMPAGGTYSGVGVNAGMFNPMTAGVGTHTITYSNGGTCTFMITVNALPTVTCPANTTVCIDAPAYALTGGNPMGGTYSGPGINGGMFNPMTAGLGAHTITYSVTDGNSCTNSCTFNITVVEIKVYDVIGGGAYCAGGSGVPVGLSDSDLGVNYQLLRNGGNIGAPVPGTGMGLNFGNQTLAGTYTVVATRAAAPNCSAMMNGSAVVTIIDLIMTDVITHSPEFCMKDPGPVVGLSGSTLGVTYQLQTAGGANLGAPVAGTGNPIFFGVYANGNYKVVATNGMGCSASVTGTVNATGGMCEIDVPAFCSCDAPSGYAPVTIKITAPQGQTWTVKEVVGLYTSMMAVPQVAIGTPLTPVIGMDMYTLDAFRSNTKGYFVKVTNGFTDLDIQVGNPSW